MTNREYMINLLLDGLESRLNRVSIDDDGASEEAMIYYNINCPYYVGDKRAYCRKEGSLVSSREVYQIIFLNKKFNAIELNVTKGGYMNELVYLKNDEPVCSSLQVAEKFEKRHANVMRAIDSLVKNDSTQNCVQCFKETTYKDSTGKSNKMYVMNRDGFTFLVMGFHTPAYQSYSVEDYLRKMGVDITKGVDAGGQEHSK